MNIHRKNIHTKSFSTHIRPWYDGCHSLYSPNLLPLHVLKYKKKNCKGYCLISSVTSWWVGMNTIWVSRKSSRKESLVEEGRLSRPPTPPPPPRPSNRVSRRCSNIFCGVPTITVYLKQNAGKMLLHSQIILYCTQCPHKE